MKCTYVTDSVYTVLLNAMDMTNLKEVADSCGDTRDDTCRS